MVSRSGIRRTMAALVLLGAGTASADPIKFTTGDVEKDMPAGSSEVTIVPGRTMGSVGRDPSIAVDGYTMKDLRLSYDAKSDTLSVGINYYGIAGNLNGESSPSGVYNPPHIGGSKSIAVAFSPVNASGSGAGTPVVIAGIPVDKSNPIRNPDGSLATLNGFKVATYNRDGVGALGAMFGQNLVNHTGNLAFDPSAEHPDFEFTIKDFSKLPGLNALTKGFYIQAYTGTGTTFLVGKSQIYNTFINPPAPQTVNPPNPIVIPPTTPQVPVLPPRVVVPEPTTVLGWGLIAGVAAWRARRRLRPLASV